jgi:putative addiction module component (TIGR02574 family)
MAMNAEQLTAEVLGLPPSNRAELAYRLIRSLDEEESALVDEEWLREIERRDAEITSGAVECLPAEEVLRRARARLS